MEIIQRVIEYYATGNGKAPYRDWFNSIKNGEMQAVIDTRIARVRAGNFGDCYPVGDGVYELRIHVHSGFRIYFGQVGNKIVLLLFGGIKKTQNRDIAKAKLYWKDYMGRLK